MNAFLFLRTLGKPRQTHGNEDFLDSQNHLYISFSEETTIKLLFRSNAC